PALPVALLVGVLPLLHGEGPRLGRRVDEPPAARAAGARDPECLPPAPDGALAGAPPDADGRRRLVAEGPGQHLGHQQARAAEGVVQGTAPRPGDAGVGPAGDDDVTISKEAEGPVPAL